MDCQNTTLCLALAFVVANDIKCGFTFSASIPLSVVVVVAVVVIVAIVDTVTVIVSTGFSRVLPLFVVDIVWREHHLRPSIQHSGAHKALKTFPYFAYDDGDGVYDDDDMQLDE